MSEVAWWVSGGGLEKGEKDTHHAKTEREEEDADKGEELDVLA